MVTVASIVELTNNISKVLMYLLIIGCKNVGTKGILTITKTLS